ncbi:protein ATP6V1FNB-like [Gigantopelta aegis]|uniref:protein ATP6V1FNB-like n=1 Tax=Gigantopelta aegis TaxID=1735272 RepID=UPI001B889925|nr:protein ATP6V1FNB-like [Gigantopelta aegis]
MAFKDFTYQYQNFVRESVEKERRTRLLWYTERKKRGTVQAPKQFEVFKRKIESLKLDVKQRLPPLANQQTKNRQEFNPTLNRSKTMGNIVEMRPPTPETKKYLYDGFTKEGKGRVHYLKERYNTIPEQKFIYPVVSSWEYGWKLDEALEDKIKKPVYGRTRTVADTFFSRNGIPKGVDRDEVWA